MTDRTPLLHQALALLPLTPDELAATFGVSRAALDAWWHAPDTMPTGPLVMLVMLVDAVIAPPEETARLHAVAQALATETAERYARRLGAELIRIGQQLTSGTLAAESFGGVLTTWLTTEFGSQGAALAPALATGPTLVS